MMTGQSSEQQEYKFSDADFREISEFVYKTIGIVLKPEKRSMVYSRLSKRLRKLNFKNFRQYCEYLKSDAGKKEIPELTNAITTNLTKFFREDHHFEHFKGELHNNLLKMRHEHNYRLRFWSAGCSSGEEPYSMAMCISDVLPLGPGWDVKILATDIDSNMVNTGRNGVYKSAQGIPQNYLNLYCDASNSHMVKLSPKLKNLITFKELNLLHKWPFNGPFDAIFCRNVVIYFDRETQAKLFDKMADMLVPNGWLYIGHSESLYRISNRFHLTGRTIYQKVS